MKELTQRFKDFKEVWKRFRYTGWIFDYHAVKAQADEGECHCHAVVVVGLDGGRLESLARIDRHAVFVFVHLDAEAGEFGAGGVDAIRFFVAGGGDAADSSWRSRKRRDRREGLGGVGEVAEVNVNAAKFGVTSDQ